MEQFSRLPSAQTIIQALESVGYLADESLATLCFLASAMQRPIYLEGEPGVGKTSLAYAIGKAFGLEVFRLQCYEGIDVSQALYDWDFRKQLLHLKRAESDSAPVDVPLYDREFLLERPILKAFRNSPCILLIDEIDRADDAFEAFLLEALSDFAVSVPEIGTIRPQVPPLVFLTSNRTREVHDALKRRCLYHWVDHPNADLELAILKRRFPMLDESLGLSIVAAVARFREIGLLKSPGVAETLDWTAALLALEATELNNHNVELTLGTLLKYREDQQRLLEDELASFPGAETP
ncbi:MoxR family ATPase [Pseudomonas sp. 5Ae-yellow]|nr:MoxR family ATPase [Pseudomonas sp. 5Ae-yellow]